MSLDNPPAPPGSDARRWRLVSPIAPESSRKEHDTLMALAHCELADSAVGRTRLSAHRAGVDSRDDCPLLLPFDTTVDDAFEAVVDGLVNRCR